jgi:hypothetical protein
MFGHRHYVPILKGKLNDITAVRNLKPATKESLTPLIEVVPPTETSNDRDRIKKTINLLYQAWGDRPFFADLVWRQDAPAVETGVHVVDEFFVKARRKQMRAIPVTALDRNPAFQQAVDRIVRAQGEGLAVRLSPTFFDGASTAPRALEALLRLTGLAPSQVDLVLDFREIGNLGTAMVSHATRAWIDMLPNVQDWRTLTVAGSSFPATLSDLPRAAWTTRQRNEWIAWLSVVTGATKPARLPSYGDYAASDPSLPYQKQAPRVANMRYSTNAEFVVYHGEKIDTPTGGTQIYRICADVVARPDFPGATFSQGDREIQERATSSSCPPGDPNKWRGWGTNHYLELVAAQIASLPAP